MSSKSTCILDDYIITDKVIGNCEHGRMLIILSRKDRSPYTLKPYKQTLESKREIETHRHACKISKHVVKIHAVYNDFELYKVPYYLVVQELMVGGTLADRLEAAQLDETESCNLMKKICLALNDLHENKIVHGDIRPENFHFVTDDLDSDLKLTNFKMATKTNTRLVDPKIVKKCFTPLYLAPEIVNSKKAPCAYSLSNDIWSLGIILYMMCYGEEPFFSANCRPNSSEMRKRIKNAEYKLDRTRDDVSSSAIVLIETLLKKEPEQRLSIHKILQSDFFKNQQVIEVK